VSSFLPGAGSNLLQRLCAFTGREAEDSVIKMIEWTGILSDEPIGLQQATPARVLQQLLEKKWLLEPHDKDMVVMQHLFNYRSASGSQHRITSTLVVTGEDSIKTAMAKTVGLPLAMAVRRLINGSIHLRGVQIPVMPDLYLPILEELAGYGIVFEETEN
jgi:saccharopine dehydrogenase-like NADP-dependent oxidoreductase